MGCGIKMIKYLLFIFNFIFVLCGLAILILGVVIHIEKKNYDKHVGEVTDDLLFPSIALIIIGSIIFIIAFFGCCGAIRESHCMVVTFASLLLTILVIQVAVAIYSFVIMKNEKPSLKELYAKNIFNEYESSQDMRDFVNWLQDERKCCGIDSYKDFDRVLNIDVPGSCCGRDPKQTCAGHDIYATGCADALKQLLEIAFAVLGGFALCIAAIELIGIIFALCLANSIKNAERRGYSV